MLVTDRELFGTVRVRRPRVLRRVVAKDLLERLQPGDLVVHIDHGISRYNGMVRRSAGGDGDEERDFLELHFAESGRIWVPVEQIERVSRYAGGENPHLSRLGGGEWPRTKTRVRKAVTDLARELLALYAARERAQGRPVCSDTPWQQELEAAFPYEETVDQLRATAEVKADLERGRPMDRLVVGDVGYGKTEVALRAAFKAIQEGHAGGGAGADDRPGRAAPGDVPPALRGVPVHGPDAVALRPPERPEARSSPGWRAGRWT